VTSSDGCPAATGNAEELIGALMRNRSMSRGEAVTAIVTHDRRERHFGRPPLVEGLPLVEIYKDEMEQGDLTIEQSANVVSYLLDVPYDVALQDLRRRIALGTVKMETRHD
jgi:hypothetical protein